MSKNNFTKEKCFGKMKTSLASISMLLMFFFSFQTQAQVTMTMSGTAVSFSPTTLAGAVTKLNGLTVTGPVIITVPTGTNETAPAGGFSITKTGTATNTITIKAVGTVTLTAAASPTTSLINDAVIKLNGVDYVTIDGFIIKENTANTILGTGTGATTGNRMTEFGIAMYMNTNTNGCQHNTITNNTITLNRSYINTVGIFASSTSLPSNLGDQTPASSHALTLAGTNSYNTITGNNISLCQTGIFLGGSGDLPANILETDNDIQNNTIHDFGTYNTNLADFIAAPVNLGTTQVYSMGIGLSNQTNYTIKGNNISTSGITGTFASSPTFGLSGISARYYNSTANFALQPTALTGSTDLIDNNTISLECNFGASGAGRIFGIEQSHSTVTVTPTETSNKVVITNNTISNISALGGGSSAINVRGISSRPVFYYAEIDHNTIKNLSTNKTTTLIRGMSISGAAYDKKILSNSFGDASNPFVTYPTTGMSGILYGLINTNGDGNPVVSSTGTITRINNNSFYNITNTGINSQAQNYIYNYVASGSGTSKLTEINNNTFNSIVGVNTTGNVAMITDLVPLNAASTSSRDVSNNSIVSAYQNAGLSGTLTLYNDLGTTSTQGNISNNNNNFSNITVAGTTQIAGWLSVDGAASNTLVKNMNSNTFSNWSGGSGNITGLTVNSTNGAATTTASLNTITGFTATAGSNAATNVTGMLIQGGTTNTIFKNKICNHEDGSSAGSVYGMSITGGLTNTVYNNVIGDYRTPTATNTVDVIRGINASDIAGTTTNLYFNTINLAASSSGTNFSVSGVYDNEVGTMNLRNNIIKNNSVAKGSGIVAALRRNGAALTSYASTSNNNIFYGGTASASQVLYYNGTTGYQTLATFQPAVSTRETSSYTENTTMSSTNCSDSNYLSLPSGGLAPGNAVAISGITNDYASTVRPAAPTIGAYEASAAVCNAGTSAPAITPTTASNTCPTTTVDLSTLANTGTVPSGATLKWSTSTTPTSSSDVLTSTVVFTSGTYYAYYYDSTNNCFSPGDSVVVSIVACNTCNTGTDTDGDGISNVCDLDDDNDGILDTAEQTCTTSTTPSYINYTLPPYSGHWIGPNSDGQPEVNNYNATTGTYFSSYTDTSSDSYTFTITNAIPNVVNKISFNLVVANYQNNGAQTSTIYANGISIGSVTGTYCACSNPSSYSQNLGVRNFTFTPTSSTVVFKFTSTANTYPSSDNYFQKISVNDSEYPVICNDKDTDNDGIPDRLDLDSDNDGCVDAIEGGATITTSQLVTAGGTATVGPGSTASNQNLCASSSCVNTSGLPQLATPSDYNNTTGQSIGTSENAATQDALCATFCYKAPIVSGAGLETKHGITALARAGVAADNWPMVRKGAWTALEAKTKGFVLNRVAFSDADSNAATPDVPTGIVATDFVKGMMVYDTTNKCLKIYDGTAWYCYTKQTCPD